ncbi:amino acid adenylation domain-containing protein, partial [Acidobacteriota bacterium]
MTDTSSSESRGSTVMNTGTPGVPGTGTGLEVAVIGMAGRFPGAKNINQFWENLKNGVESLSFLTDRELKDSGLPENLLENPGYVKTRGGVLGNKDYFDASFFDYTPFEAELLNPQTRIFYECSWEALENAAYNPFTGNQVIGIYAGAEPGFYWEAMAVISGKTNVLGEFTSGLLTRENTLCTRVSYHLNLKGPAVVVQTACSTSLAAIHIACQALLNGECNIALAGGVTVLVLPGHGYLYQEGMVMSPDGHCRAFDAKANGMACGEGCGIVVLKLLEQAINDNDFIHAMIKGTALNNDGIRKAGYTAPSVVGQAEAVKIAQKVAEVEPESITYVETHGTGTVLGDPIEIKALKQAFNTNKKEYCAIGSVKSNVGHLGSAAGVTGFIKTVLALKHRLIPPSLHFETPNPEIPFENSPFYVNTKLQPWKNERYPLRAGVSSFGIGGTNAHVILEEWPDSHSPNAWRTVHGAQSQGRGGVSPPSSSREYQLVLLSAKTESALDKVTENLAEYFEKNAANPGSCLADVAYTLQVGRQALQNRKMLVCSTGEEAVEILSTPASQREYTGQVQDENPPVIFVFSGLGSQYVNMGRDLYEKEPYFRQQMDCCFELLKGLPDYDIKEILYPDISPQRSQSTQREDDYDKTSAASAVNIHQTEIAQVVVFIFEYALAKLLIRWGIKPYAMIGYSFGEYTAACIAGLLSLAAALELVTTRGQLLKKIPNGVMLSVPFAKEELISFLPANLSLAIDNGPSCVVAGTPGAVAAFEKEMKARKCLTMRLQASHAVHSYMMEPILKEFEEAAAGITWQEPETPYISNVTGDWIDLQQVSAPSYWAKHLRETVCFAPGLQQLLKEPNAVFVEVGPGRDIRALVTRAVEINSNNSRQSHHQRRVINLVRPREKEIADNYYLLHKLGLLWLLGVSINWREYYRGEKRYRLPLPTYPFERHRFWTMVQDYQSKKIQLSTGMSGMPVPGKSRELADWFYVPLWKRQKIFHVNSKDDIDNGEAGLCWWVFIDGPGLGERLVNGLNKGKDQQHRVITIQIGPGYKKQNSFLYTINPVQYEDYQTLLAELNSTGGIPDRIVHLWGITRDNNEGIEPQSIEKHNDLGFYSLLYLAKALGQNKDYTGEIGINVVTNHMQSVTGDEYLSPGKVTVLGPCCVIPQEYPGIACKSIDVDQWQSQEVLQRLLEEVRQQPGESVVAYRGTQRWVQTFEAVHLEKREVSPLLREKGVYLITGGLGDIGYTLAEYLIKRVYGKVILTGRSQLPARETWTQYLNNGDKEDWTCQGIRKMQQLLELGGEVLYFGANAADGKAMQEAIQQGEERFGPINGVIHSAGIIRGESFKSIHEITTAECQRQFQAKIYGLMVLEELLQGKPLDFGLVISSLSTVLGGLEFAAYSAANHFMDAFCAKHNQENQVPWIVVDWEGTNKEDTADAFHRILSADSLEQVIFSIGGDLKARISRWVKLQGISPEKKKNRSTPIRSRPALLNPYLPPRHDFEEKLAEIWQDFFGIDKIGVTDDLFDLGGDSLKMINIIAIIYKKLKVTIPIKEFFDHSTIEGVARYIKGTKTEEYIPISPAETKQYYILSSAQKRLYILQQMEKNTVAYNSPYVVLLEGHPDREQLQQSVGQMIRRHESLRTSIVMKEEQPVQVIHDKEAIEFFLEYYDSLAEHQSSGSTRDIIKNFVRPFDLSRPPFLRMGLIKIEEAQYILMFDVHHIVTDGVSHEIFVKELMTLYAGEELPPLDIQYKDYSEWQTSPRQQEALARQEAYWLTQFQAGGDIPVLLLPYDYARPTVQDFEGNIAAFGIGKERTRKLKELAVVQQVTLFMVLLGIYDVFLARLTSQEDFVVGIGVAGRRHPDLAHVMGIFVNTLAVRNYPQTGKTFGTLLKEIKVSTLNAFENQEYPFEELVKKLEVNRDTGRNPLFDTMLVLQNVDVRFDSETRAVPEPASALNIKPYDYHRRISKFDLTLFVEEVNDELRCCFEYCTKLFKPETIALFITYFTEIVASSQGDLGQTLKDMQKISEERRKTIIRQLNQQLGQETETFIESGITLQMKLKDGFTRFSHHTAIEYGHQILTYEELSRRSANVTHWIINKGIPRQTFIGILLEDRVDFIAVMMGILNAGCIFVPFNPSYPRSRLESMIATTSIKLIVTDSDINLGQPVEFALIHHLVSSAEPRADKIPAVLYSPEDSIYIYFTSGTTGIPRAMKGKNRSLLHFIDWEIKTFDISERFRFSQFTTPVFDAFLRDVFVPLCAGGVICIPGSKETLLHSQQLIQWLDRCRIHLIHCVPGLFRLLNTREYVSRNHFKQLKYILLSGERINPSDLEEWYKTFEERIQLVNLWGTSETTLAKTFYFIQPSDIHRERIPVGKPIKGARVVVLDENLDPLDHWVTGELYIKTPFRTAGYQNDPELNRQRFIPDPFNPGTDILLHKTGDMGRILVDGNIDLLGRNDRQVKIRGIRIELEEVERVLAMHPQVKEAVARKKELPHGNELLCAYIVEKETTGTVGAAELVDYLSRRLPDYMVPGLINKIDEIPRTTSGKIDYKALADIDVEKHRYIPPHNHVQRRLVELWADILKIEKSRISITDNFFSLGGNSLNVMNLISRVHRDFDIRVPLADIFNNPTIRQLTEIIGEEGK